MKPHEPKEEMLKKLQELHRKVDEFFATTAKRCGSALSCHPGCHGCCHEDLTVSSVEADLLCRFLQGASREVRGLIRERVQKRERCVFLHGTTGRCLIYPARPIICRSHGLPLLTREGPHETPRVSVCPENFKKTDLTQEDTLNIDTVNTLLFLINSLYGEKTPRTALSELAGNALSTLSKTGPCSSPRKGRNSD